MHVGDIIDVDLSGGSEYNWRGPLTPDGYLAGLDEVGGPIYALCRSEAELAKEITRIYSRMLRTPGVTVRIIDRSNRPVATLQGAVKNPTRFRLLRSAHLRELLVSAGGLTDDTSGDILILRPEHLNCAPQAATEEGGGDPQRGNGLIQLNITVKDLLKGTASADPVIMAGDMITVVKARPIYVMGAVNSPRPIYTHTGMTLSRAVDAAGGLAKGALPRDVTVFRREGNDSRVIKADLERIKSGQDGDVDLQAFDIIDVASKGRPKSEHPPVITNGGSQYVADPPLKIIE